MRGSRSRPGDRSTQAPPDLPSPQITRATCLRARCAPHSPSPLSTPASTKVLTDPVRQPRSDLPRSRIRVRDWHRNRVFVEEARAEALLDRGQLLLVATDPNEERRLFEQRLHNSRDLRAPGILKRNLERLHLDHADVFVVDQDIRKQGRDLETAVERLDEAPPPVNQEGAAQEKP